MALNIIYRGNSTLIELTGLIRKSVGEAVNNAIVTLTITDLFGVEVPGQAWPISMTNVADSAGDYRAHLEPSLILPSRVIAHISANDGGIVGDWKTIFNVKTRR